jgi:hypothetical protein
MDESMIARQDERVTQQDVWEKLAAALPAGSISWRQDGKPVRRDDRFYARFVAYVDANTVRERLDSVVPGEWDLTLELLPTGSSEAGDEATFSFKARLQVLGVIREDVGTGRDYKSAATDAFKRAAVRFGIAHELYAYEANWVEVDGESRNAKPIEDPQAAYVRRHGRTPAMAPAEHPAEVEQDAEDSAPRSTLTDLDAVSCPKCGGRMWDNRATKRNPRAPDFRCRNRSCDGVIWPPVPRVQADTPQTDNAAA